MSDDYYLKVKRNSKKGKFMITRKTQSVVSLINQVIDEAVADGGDAGGSYHHNINNLEIAVNNLINALGLFVDYEVIYDSNATDSWSLVKIIPKKNAFICTEENSIKTYNYDF